MLGVLFPLFLSAEQVCVSTLRTQNSPFLGTSLGKSLVTAPAVALSSVHLLDILLYQL